MLAPSGVRIYFSHFPAPVQNFRPAKRDIREPTVMVVLRNVTAGGETQELWLLARRQQHSHDGWVLPTARQSGELPSCWNTFCSFPSRHGKISRFLRAGLPPLCCWQINGSGFARGTLGVGRKSRVTKKIVSRVGWRICDAFCKRRCRNGGSALGSRQGLDPGNYYERLKSIWRSFSVDFAAAA
jgi:hypothetical protein